MTAGMRFLAPVAAAIVAATVLAPTAAARSNPANCQESGAAKVCQRPGHSSLHTKPEVRNPAGSLFSSPWLPGYGRGHLPPLIALD